MAKRGDNKNKKDLWSVSGVKILPILNNRPKNARDLPGSIRLCHSMMAFTISNRRRLHRLGGYIRVRLMILMGAQKVRTFFQDVLNVIHDISSMISCIIYRFPTGLSIWFRLLHIPYSYHPITSPLWLVYILVFTIYIITIYINAWFCWFSHHSRYIPLRSTVQWPTVHDRFVKLKRMTSSRATRRSFSKRVRRSLPCRRFAENLTWIFDSHSNMGFSKAIGLCTYYVRLIMVWYLMWQNSMNSQQPLKVWK